MKALIFFMSSLFFLFEVFTKWPDQYLHLNVCDVGQGDAILLSLGFTQVLIDTGPDEKVLSCLNKKMPFWDKQLDALILTHFDDDHIGGFMQLAQVYQIKYIFLPMTDYKDSKTFLKLKEQISAMRRLGTVVKEPFLGQQIAFSKFSLVNQAKYNSIDSSLLLSFLTPFELSEEKYQSLEQIGAFLWQKPENNLSVEDWQNLSFDLSDNDGSIVIFAQFGVLKILLMGDLESTREVALTDRGLITQVDIQKVGHHGSKTSSSINFLLQSRPEISLISCGLNNQFGHPNTETLQNLESIDSQIWRTDQLGTIEIVSNGQQFWLR